MANYANLKAAIDAVIKANGQQEITGPLLNQVLKAMVNALGAGYLFMGIAEHDTNPNTPDQNVFYIALEEGTYTHFGNAQVHFGISLLFWYGQWSVYNLVTFSNTVTDEVEEIPTSYAVFNAVKDAAVYDVTAHSGQRFASLNSLLSSPDIDTLIPPSVRKAGMTIMFTSPAHAVQQQSQLFKHKFFFNAVDMSLFTNVNRWVGIETTVTQNSLNVPTSGAVYAAVNAAKVETIAEAGVYDVTANNDGATFDSLSALLNDEDLETLIPVSRRKGGMSIKFVRTSDNKYVQARLMADSFTTDIIQWQVVESIPKYKSKNLIESGSVYELKENLSLIDYKETAIQVSSAKSNVPKTDGTLVSGGSIIGRYDISIDNVNCVIDFTTVVSNYSEYNDIAAWALYSGSPSSANLLTTGAAIGQNNDISVIVKNYPTAKTLSIVADFTNPTIQGVIKTLDMNYLTEDDVINSLDSDSTNKPLSAAQGKALNGKLTTKTYITGGDLKSQIPTSDGTLTSGASLFGRKDYSLVGVSGVVYIESDAPATISPEQWSTAVLFAVYDSSNHFIVAGDLLTEGVRQSSIDLSNYPTAALLRVTCSFSSGVVSVYTNEDKYASKEDLDELQNEVDSIRDSVSVELPSEIIMVKGTRVELFTRAFVKCFNPYIYHIEPICTIGKAYPRYILFKIQDEWIGHNYTLTINVRNNDGKVIATGNTVIKVINKATSPASMKNVLVFGSSLMAKGYVASELKRRLTETSGDTSSLNPKGDGLSNISFVGRKVGSRVDTIHQEGTGGWAWEDYAGQGREAYRFYVENVESVNIGDVYSINSVSLTVVEVNIVGANEIRCTRSNSRTIPASGTLTKVSGDGDATITYTSYDSESYNPFYYNGGLNFENYANLYCDGHIDYLVGYMGTNLVGQSNVVTQTINNIKTIANAYHADFPNGKFLIVSQALPDPTGGMGADYGCSSVNNYYTYAKVVWDLAAAFNELANDDNYKDFVVLVPNTQQFDCEYSYPFGMAAVNNRSSETVRLGQNGLHPSDTEEYQVSDSIYSVMHKLLSL